MELKTLIEEGQHKIVVMLAVCTMGVKWSNCWPISNESPRGKDDGDALDDRCESF